MKKILFAVLLLTAVVGCRKDKSVDTLKDNRPVAPTVYVDGQSRSTDPQLPPMVPHWKESK